MGASMSRYDWHELATHSRLRELARLLRGTFDVWVGFLDEDGQAVPIGRGEIDHWKPVCEQFKANALESEGDDDATTSCRGTLQDWSERLNRDKGDDAPHELTCHAGLSAWIAPIDDEMGETIGGLYVSGFLPGMDAAARRRAIRQTLDEHELANSLDNDALERLPALGESDHQLAALLVDRMQTLASEVIQRESDPLDDGEPARFEGMIGQSPQMQTLFETIEQVADTNSTVLIEGENGTGKELVARAIHRRSRRVDARFVALNCAAIPAQLIESELFGHKKGAFSGAHRDSKGLCEEAHQGTLMLDEIGDMETSLQSKLLRFLQNGEFSPVGSSQSRSVDIRVLCATNQDLERLVETGHFRRDLYFRLNVIRLRLPPLRERKTDIPLLLDHFASESASQHGLPKPTWTDACERRLMAHDWPGNVRELKNEVERLVIMHRDGDPIEVDDLSPEYGGEPDVDLVPFVDDMTLPEATEQLERKMILEALRETDWNKTRAAERLDISRRHLIRKVSDYELEAQYRDDA